MLTKAVTENRIDIAGFLLENGLPIPSEAHLLHIAAANDNRDMLALLRRHYSSLDDRDEAGRTPLHLVRSAATAEWLLKRGAQADVCDAQGRFPHEAVSDEAARQLLKECYERLHPEPTALSTRQQEPASPEEWSRRFTMERLTLKELIPINDREPDLAKMCFNDREYRFSKRFFSSFARRMKFSTNVFNYFSPQEFLSRVAERKPDISFQVTFDNRDGLVLGVTDPDHKILPPHIVCEFVSADPRTESVSYANGVWEATLQLDETFNVPQAGDYRRKLLLNYPVDGLGMPSISLAVMRQVCRNGMVAAVAQFRTDIEVNDQSGRHLGKLLRSFSNEYGFSALNERLIAAQNTVASVNEFLSIDALLAANISSREMYLKLHDRLNEVAGDPCYQYAVTSLQNIPRKKQALMPVACSVNDLLSFCSELTTHHGRLLSRPRVFDEKAGQMLSQEFDLEGMYHAKDRTSPDFFLADLALGGDRVGRSQARPGNRISEHAGLHL